jgi:hypothetical protein
MSHKKPRKQIRLNRETLKKLTPEQASLVVGGNQFVSKRYAASSDDPAVC